MTNPVKLVDLANTTISAYKNRFVGCVVYTKNHKILLQQRDHEFITYPNYLCEFGGLIQHNERPIQALIRELNQELGAFAKEPDIISLGVISEIISNHSELVYAYFWHDSEGTIDHCYEGEARYFDNVPAILNYPQITDGLRWMLQECQIKGLFNVD